MEPTRHVTVGDIQVMGARGPWNSKSGGKLMVTFALGHDDLKGRYLNYEPKELDLLPSDFDIRGLRIYTVREIPEGTIGGTEWHRIREEMVYVLEGSVKWICEDLHGGKREFLLTEQEGVWMPPFILHTYSALEPNSGLLVVANTMFDPDNPATHDTYSAEVFREMAGKIWAKAPTQ